MPTPTLTQDLTFYGTTRNEPEGGYRPLLMRAATEVSRLEGLAGPVKCMDCEKVIERAGEWFRCFDCKAHLCEGCITKHFGMSYTPHHQRMENYKRTIDRLQAQVKAHEDAAERDYQRSEFE